MDFKNLNKRKLEEEVEIDAEKLKKSELYKDKGNELFKKSMYDEALDYYFKSITLNPTDHRCYANIGQILINKGLYSEAKECLQAAVDLDSNYTKAYYRLGLVEKHLKNYEEALRNFDKVLKLEPNNKATIKECDEIKSKLGISGTNSLNGSSGSAGRDAVSDLFKMTASKAGRPSKPDQASTKPNASSTKPDAASVKSTASSVKPNPSPGQLNASSAKPNTSSARPTAGTLKIDSPVNQPKKATIKVENIAFPKLPNIPVRLPDSRPKTAYQFNLFWKEIRDRQTKLDYLQFIGADEFLRLFQKNLEPDFLSELVVLFEHMEPSLAYALLSSISKIEKFDFFIMFLSNAEKVSLRKTIQSLQADAADLELLLKLYKV